MSLHFKRNGFTIVELLIVIVVIAILAAISVVAYNGIQQRADTASRISEFRAWSNLLQMYMVNEGRLPIVSGVIIDNGSNEATYCLGTGYPDTDYRASGYNTGSCRSMYASDAQAFQRGHVEPNLNTELAKAGQLPSGPRTCPAGECTLGPYLNIYSTTTMELSSVFAATQCPDNTTEFYRYPASPNTRIVGCKRAFSL